MKNGKTFKQPARIKECGFSVFREVNPNDAVAIDRQVQAISKRLGSTTLRHGRFESSYAVHILETWEPNTVPQVGKLAVRSALDTIWESATSLRRNKKVKLDGVVVLGRRNSRTKAVALTFENQDTLDLYQERLDIFRVLGLMSLESNPRPIEEFSALRHTPHLTLLRVGADIEDDAVKEVKAIANQLPDTIELSRATFYNPSSSKLA